MDREVKRRASGDQKCINKARHNGYLAGLNGAPRDANPHILTVPEFAQAWNEGWENAHQDLQR